MGSGRQKKKTEREVLEDGWVRDWSVEGGGPGKNTVKLTEGGGKRGGGGVKMCRVSEFYRDRT